MGSIWTCISRNCDKHSSTDGSGSKDCAVPGNKNQHTQTSMAAKEVKAPEGNPSSDKGTNNGYNQGKDLAIMGTNNGSNHGNDLAW